MQGGAFPSSASAGYHLARRRGAAAGQRRLTRETYGNLRGPQRCEPGQSGRAGDAARRAPGAWREEGETDVTPVDDSRRAGDPYDLSRFVHAQAGDYERALAELRSGQKRTHWMWYIFPQLDGLAVSATAKRYAIKSVAEAQAYLAHPILGPRLRQCAEAVLGLEGRSATAIFGSPDDLKLRSCATLFACAAPPGSVFDRLLGKYYRGERDPRTLQLLGK